MLSTHGHPASPDPTPSSNLGSSPPPLISSASPDRGGAELSSHINPPAARVFSPAQVGQQI